MMMSSVCISKCVNDARDPHMPVRATYVNLYKWPESDAEFVRAMSSRSSSSTTMTWQQARVVDSLSCRQMYLRSYKFSTHTTENHDSNVSHKYCCFLFKRNNSVIHNNNTNNKKCLFLKKLNHFAHAIFRKCLSCTTTVDVVDHHH